MDLFLFIFLVAAWIFFWIFLQISEFSSEFTNFWISKLSSKFQNLVSQFLRFPKFPNFKTKFPNFQQNLVATWFLPNFYRFSKFPNFFPDFLISFRISKVPSEFFQTFLRILAKYLVRPFFGFLPNSSGWSSDLLRIFFSLNFSQSFRNLISEFVDQIWYSPEFLRISWPIFFSLKFLNFCKKKSRNRVPRFPLFSNYGNMVGCVWQDLVAF